MSNHYSSLCKCNWSYVKSAINWSRLKFQLWMKTVSVQLLYPHHGYTGCVDKSFYLSANYMKDKHCSNLCDQNRQKAKDCSHLKEKFSDL